MKKIIKYSIFCSILILLGSSGNLLRATPFEEDQKVSIQAETKTNKLETADITVKEEKTSEEKKKEESSSDSSAKTEEIEGIVQVGNSCLRLREYPWGPVISTYTTNTKCTILGEEGEFYKVNINGTIGYMHKNFVSTAKQPASEIEPDYPGNCRRGGYIARTTPSDTSSNNKKVADSNSNNSSNSNSKVEVKTSVIGQPAGDGTAAGAVTWAKDQMAGGSKKGLNRNNKKTSSDPKCWNYWCGAFVGTAWGHKIPQMCAGSAYGQYKNFKRDGMIHTDKNPPAGAIMFTGPTATNEYGHVFLASGEVDANGEPIVITSGWNGHDGITTMTLSRMIGRNTYLGWALPE